MNPNHYYPSLPPHHQHQQYRQQYPTSYPRGGYSGGNRLPHGPPPSHQMMPNQEWLKGVFDKVDRDHSGQISTTELQGALSNGTWRPFNAETIRMMIAMFDKDKTGQINFEEFCHLWRYVTDWLNCFRSFDKDNSGSIDPNELRQALTSFGYRFSDNFLNLLMKRYDRTGRGQVTFDDFIQLCVQLQSLTNAFRQFDTDMDGWINISYEQFLTMVINIALQ